MNRQVVLVTGGCGFIGTHVVRELADQDYQVWVLDDMSAGDPSRLHGLVAKNKVVIIRGDVADRSVVRQTLERSKPWGVVHLAAPTSVTESKSNPDRYYESIVQGSNNVVFEAARAGVARIVNTNSAATYGQARVIPTPETYPAEPTNPYGVAKFLGEQAILHWGRVLGVGTVSLRLANIYGEYSSALFGLFLRQWRTGQPLTITGNGSQLRDFTFVEDLSRGIVLFLESSIDTRVINFGKGDPISVMSMAQLFYSDIRFIERSKDEPDAIYGSTDLLRTLLPAAVPTSRADDVVPQLLERLKSKWS